MCNHTLRVVGNLVYARSLFQPFEPLIVPQHCNANQLSAYQKSLGGGQKMSLRKNRYLTCSTIEILWPFISSSKSRAIFFLDSLDDIEATDKGYTRDWGWCLPISFSSSFMFCRMRKLGVWIRAMICNQCIKWGTMSCVKVNVPGEWHPTMCQCLHEKTHRPRHGWSHQQCHTWTKESIVVKHPVMRSLCVGWLTGRTLRNMYQEWCCIKMYEQTFYCLSDV